MRTLLLLIVLPFSIYASAQDKRIYAGTVNGNLEITLYLEGLETGTHADAILGAYQYAGKKNFLLLNGYFNNAGNVCLTELATPNFSGVFLGTLVKNKFAGFWTSADGKTRYPFALVQMEALPAEIARFAEAIEKIGAEFHSY